MGISDIRNTARQSLHEFMGRAAFFYADPDADPKVPVKISVRAHSKVAKAGDLAGTNLSYAESHDRRETVIFWREEVADIPRNAVVVLSPDEGYFVDNVMPPNGQTVTAEVIRCEGRDLDGFTAPDGTLIDSGS